MGGDLNERGRANRLAAEKSPYLLQHAHNPVDWYPWGEEAFAKAARESKPIFLSVGYSTCHWCHVMERESFENPEIAALMNQWFVSIKVDREERPDVDRVYMNAAFAITGQGGWPLSVFLTPELEPFFAGTYFPPDDRYGRAGFPSVLRGVHEAWESRREQVRESAGQLTAAIRRSLEITPDTAAVEVAAVRERGYRQLMESYDSEFGGFGRAPKFPQPSYLLFAFREWDRLRDGPSPTAALETLRRMATGGIYDHLGGGFHRYSVDAEWKVPHFEKMLYDQGQLVVAYLEAYQISGEGFFADVARDILAYVDRDLSDPGGGFTSAEDADSPVEGGEPEEGAFYVWTVAEVESILGRERARPLLERFHMSPEGNFEHGRNVLHAAGAREVMDRSFAEERRLLLAARQRRPRPHLDDKVLAAWNGLMISAYAKAHQVLGDERYLARARRAADFVLERLYDEKTGTLRRRFRDGEAAIAGELTDYAFLTQGLLDLYEAGFETRDLQTALRLTETQVALFWDAEQGGFFDTAVDAGRRLFVRTKETHDGAEPSGNSVSVLNLARLAAMTGNADLEAKARATLALWSAHAARSPLALTYLWTAADFLDGKSRQVVIAGRRGAADTGALLAVVRRPFLPRKVVLLADGGGGQRWLAERLEFLRTVAPQDGRATAYVCEDFVCRLPASNPEIVARQLAEARGVALER